jgi:predicted nucleic acid-binding protein
MARLFLDSSALVKAYVQERGSAWVASLLTATPPNSLYISRLTGIEVVSAISRKARSGGLSTADAATGLAEFRVDFPLAFNIVELSPALAEAAARLAERHGLRAYDAVQLAAAIHVQSGHTPASGRQIMLISADADLSAAAEVEGLAVDDPNTHP